MDSATHSNANKDEGRPSRSPSADQAIVPMDDAPQQMERHQDQNLNQNQDQDLQLAIRDEDCEYGCKFCDKKFSNKQALGGHQNAHKVERSVEKTTPNMHDASRGYYAADAPPNPPPLLGPYQRNDLLNRAYIPWPYPNHQQQQQHQQQQHYYAAARPVMQMPDPYGPRPVYNNVYQGRNQVPARLPYIANKPNYLNQGGYISFQAGLQRPVYDFQAAPGFPGQLRLGLERNQGINFANLRNAEDIDEAGLDLRLRL